jgi:hypothetical protein
MTPLERLLAVLLLVSASAVIYRRTCRLLREAEQRDAATIDREALANTTAAPARATKWRGRGRPGARP